MTEAARQAALGALRSAQGAAARITPERDAEDVAADLIETWGSTETSMRALLNGSPLSGQDLVREVRKREMLTLAQAHALLDFLTVRDRLNDQAYKPTAIDIDAARSAIAHLESAISAPELEPAITPPPPPVESRPAGDAGTAPVAVSGGRRFTRVPVWAWIVLAVVAIGLAGGGAYFGLRGGDDLAEGRRMLRENRREAARAEFERVARENPRLAESHLFLARMARDDGDLAAARRHAEAAIRADPANGLGYREMGTILYAGGNYELARSFLERAIRALPNDPTAQGVMGCTLVRLGRPDVGQRFLTRAGPGPWRECASYRAGR